MAERWAAAGDSRSSLAPSRRSGDSTGSGRGRSSASALATLSRPPRVSAVIPTLGASPWLSATLTSLRRSAGDLPLELIVVDQASSPLPSDALAGADRVVRLPRNLGFAGGTNAGIEVATGDWIATINDDVVVTPGWLPALLTEAVEPGVVAVQGVNLHWQTGAQEARYLGSAGLVVPSEEIAAGEVRVDGAGIAWNRWLQALQDGHGEAPPSVDMAPRRIFGVSATAALYRRSALDDVRLPGSRRGEIFDSRLGSYYEDVDLACRLRRQGGAALLVPAARAWHAASTTGNKWPRLRTRQLYGNRHLVLARALGRGYLPRLARLLRRDLRDLGGALTRMNGSAAAGIVDGWLRAVQLLPDYLHWGPRLEDLLDESFWRAS